jgi:hypothetical protein
MSGLTCEQLDELEERVAQLLEEPWDKGTGRPRELTLREALIVSCGYARNNITEEIWAEIFDVHQATISRYISELTPLIDRATEEFRPTAEEAAEASRDAIALVDGTLWPGLRAKYVRCSMVRGEARQDGHQVFVVSGFADSGGYAAEASLAA